MANYYFLITAFAPLSLDARPQMSFKELKELLVMNLTLKDLHLVNLLLLPLDLYNLRAVLLKEQIDERGSYSVSELEEGLLVKDGLPEFVIDYLDQYESTEERLKNFASLFAALYQREKDLTGFLSKYYRLEREIRLTLTALRAKKAGRGLVKELQFEDPYDPFVAEILAQKDMPEFTPPREYEYVKTLFLKNYDNPYLLNKEMTAYRLEKIADMDENHKFGIDRILSYTIRLLLIEKLYEEGKEKGMERLSQYE